MEPQGWVILGTKMDNKQLTRDLKQQKKMLEQHEKEAKELLELKSKYEVDTTAYEEREQALKESHD